MAANDRHAIFVGQYSAAYSFLVEVRFASGVYQLRSRCYTDAGAWVDSAWYTITDAAHAVEMDWQAATAAGANNGTLSLWLDGTLQQTSSGVDNDTRRIDTVRLGPLEGLDAGTSGAEYFDAFESRRSTYIGGMAHGKAGVYSLATLPQAKRDHVGRALKPQPSVTALGGAVPGQTWKVYYYAAAQMIAMREISGTTQASTLYYLHSDHLGSTSLVTNASGGFVSRQSYYAYGGIRANGNFPTDIGFTAQRSETGLGSLMFFRARFYSPLSGRFLSADTLVPGAGNPQALNRYMFVLGNPVKYTDPSGNCSGDPNDPTNSDATCWGMITLIQGAFSNISVDPDLWTTEELEILFEALQGIYDSFGSDSVAFSSAFGPVTFHRAKKHVLDGIPGQCCVLGATDRSDNITIYDAAFAWGHDGARWTILHEMGHQFDNPNGWGFIFQGQKSTDFAGSIWPNCVPVFSACYDWNSDGASGTPVSGYARANSQEDFAESFAAYIADQNGWNLFPLAEYNYGDRARKNIINNWINLTVQRPVVPPKQRTYGGRE